MKQRRVVITGMGTVNALSHDVGGYWRALLAGQSGIGPIDLFDVSPFKVRFGGQVRNFDPDPHLGTREARRMDRFAQFAVVATLEALKDSGLELSRRESDQFGFELPRENPDRVGVILGSGIGGLNEYEEQHTRLIKSGPGRISPFTIPKLMVNAAPGQISIAFGIRGPNMAVATACASAANAVGDAMRAIQHDEAEVMITGGSEAAMTPMGLGGFIAARALSERNDAPQLASRPFDKNRDGFILSEGAGVVVLEELEHARKRGARIYAELIGYGSSADAYNITAPCPDGSGAAKAMTLALKDARTNPDEVDYVNAHGTSTPLGDEAETKAIKQVFGDQARKLAINSTKSMIGHLLGASGGVELIVTALSIHHGVVHPTINYESPDPACDLDYVPNAPRELRIRKAISNSFGFGGHNACLVLGAVSRNGQA
jgi:3-oxoacyl-[acyl-carrier-protein] synthase II